MMRAVSDCYKKPPISIGESEIPVFSKFDFYIENYDRISADHLKHFELTGHNPFMPEDHWCELENSTEDLVKKYVREPGSKILDVGVGMGRLLERFPSLLRFGMDISLGYLKHAKSKGIEVCLSRIEDMPYKEKYFDAVVSTDVLEHVLDLNLVIKEILSVVKDDGVIVIRVPYKEDLGLYLRQDFPYELVHLRSFDENSLRLLFEKIFNVKVLEITFTGYKYGGTKFGYIKFVSGLVRRIVAFSDWFSSSINKKLAKIFIQPVEINIVIKNSKIHSERH